MHERANGNRRAGYQRISASNQAEARRVEQPRCGLSNLWVNMEKTGRPVGGQCPLSSVPGHVGPRRVAEWLCIPGPLTTRALEELVDRCILLP